MLVELALAPGQLQVDLPVELEVVLYRFDISVVQFVLLFLVLFERMPARQRLPLILGPRRRNLNVLSRGLFVRTFQVELFLLLFLAFFLLLLLLAIVFLLLFLLLLHYLYVSHLVFHSFLLALPLSLPAPVPLNMSAMR